MNAGLKYIIVDDDPLNNTIYSIIIKTALGEVDIKTFTHPEDGLEFIQNKYVQSHTVLFLDLNMPTLTGWEFLEEYGKFNEELKKQIHIYLLTSSIDQRDKDKAKDNIYVKGFISKPLDSKTITSIAEKEFYD
ncbi:MAG: response regulator containing a CheY-like receiver domain and an DNA-binding domain [Mucilaginibacter sp.]|nr:response regulator containing a CheY-like receiver domain and an DNA-binding domain [Mucilaginibacter sp.]